MHRFVRQRNRDVSQQHLGPQPHSQQQVQHPGTHSTLALEGEGFAGLPWTWVLSTPYHRSEQTPSWARLWLWLLGRRRPHCCCRCLQGPRRSQAPRGCSREASEARATSDFQEDPLHLTFVSSSATVDLSQPRSFAVLPGGEREPEGWGGDPLIPCTPRDVENAGPEISLPGKAMQ